MKDTNRFLLPAYLLALFGIAALAVFLILQNARSSSAQGWNRGPNEIVFAGWGGPEEKEVFTNLVAEFERLNPDVKVRYITVPQNYTQKLQIMMAGGTPPDVFYIPDGDFPAFVVKQTMEPLDAYIAKSRVIKPAEFWPSALYRYQYDIEKQALRQGAQYALPKDIGPFAMYYNKDLFRKAGIPFPSATKAMTWDEALPVWKKLTVTNPRYRDVIDQFGVANFPMEAAVWSNGGEFLSEDGRQFLLADSPEGIEAIQWLSDLSNKHHAAPTQREARSMNPDALFSTGKLACFFTGRWGVPTFRRLNFDWDVAPIPVSPRTRKQAGWSGSVGLAMAKTCPNKEAAWRFIEFIAGPVGQIAQTKLGFQIPNQRYLATQPVFLQPGKKPENAEVFLGAALVQKPGVATLAPTNEWLTQFNQRIPRVWDGSKTADAGLKEMKAEVQNALDRSWQQDY